MKPKKILSVFFVLLLSFLFIQSAMAQEADKNIDEVLIGGDQEGVKRTRELMSGALMREGSQLVGNDNQFFLINLDSPIGVMRNSASPDKTEYWYLIVNSNEEEILQGIVEQAELVLPEKFALSQNYPNPFNPSTTIKFQIPNNDGSQPLTTVLRIYDVLGKLVRTVVDEEMAPGFYTRQWDGLNDRGVRISTGVYFYTLTAGEFQDTKKMLMIK